MEALFLAPYSGLAFVIPVLWMRNQTGKAEMIFLGSQSWKAWSLTIGLGSAGTDLKWQRWVRLPAWPLPSIRRTDWELTGKGLGKAHWGHILKITLRTESRSLEFLSVPPVLSRWSLLIPAVSVSSTFPKVFVAPLVFSVVFWSLPAYQDDQTILDSFSSEFRPTCRFVFLCYDRGCSSFSFVNFRGLLKPRCYPGQLHENI